MVGATNRPMPGRAAFGQGPMGGFLSHRYPVPAGPCRVEEEIQRSRFITSAAPAETIEVAQAFIAAIRAEFADATHNCWAFLVGPPGSSGRVGKSDDGEPHGTAGTPMLNVLSHCGLGDIVCVVTRYYGGTKLGKGGLMRAYSGGVQLALERLVRIEKVAYRAVTLVVPYPAVALVRMAADRSEVRFRGERYESDVTYALDVPEDALTQFLREVEDLTHGAALWELD